MEGLKKCSKEYGFSYEEALNLCKKEVSGSIMLPFSKSVIKESCWGIEYNGGLFTQCVRMKCLSSDYCKICVKSASVSESGIPVCGNVSMRLSCELMEYRDLKGRKPIAYRKYLESKSLSLERAIEYAKSCNIVLDEVHLKNDETKVKRGRPVKESVPMECSVTEDLFAKLINDTVVDTVVSQVDTVVDTVVPQVDTVVPKVDTKKTSKLSDEEKSIKKQELAEAKQLAKQLAKQAEAEAKQLAKQKAIEAKQKAIEVKQLAKQLLKQEADAKKALQKESKKKSNKSKVADKETKVADNESKVADKETKVADNESKVADNESKVADNESKVADNESKVADKVETKVTVKRVTINGVEYLKSTTGVLYDEKTKEEMGIYDEETKTIKAIEYDDDEEEDEYEY